MELTGAPPPLPLIVPPPRDDDEDEDNKPLLFDPEPTANEDKELAGNPEERECDEDERREK